MSRGCGAAQDYTQAVDWYRKAAEQNEAAAQYSLGLMYEQGTGVPRNLTEASRWYQLAAKNGDPDAKARPAQHVHQGSCQGRGTRQPHQTDPR